VFDALSQFDNIRLLHTSHLTMGDLSLK
jgi:hypothetical protein